jgi:hypothetical protein
VVDESFCKSLIDIALKHNIYICLDCVIPQQFEHFILANSLLIGNNEKSNENMGKNKDGNYEEHNSNNVFPDYETCDEMPKYEDWF